MNPLVIIRNYDIFRANNRYSYPFLFFVLGALKNLLQFSVLGIAGWAIFQIGSGFEGRDSVVENATAGSAAPVVLDSRLRHSEAVEVQAAVNGSAVAGVDGITRPDPLKTCSLSGQDAQVLSWEWILRQDAGKYTIQYGSSPDKQRVYETANAFPLNEIVAVFPFKKTPGNRPVYGFSSGLYGSLESARQAIERLPESVRSAGPWIRSIDKLQKEIVIMLDG